jgi:hypothetical protein
MILNTTTLKTCQGLRRRKIRLENEMGAIALKCRFEFISIPWLILNASFEIPVI